MPSTPWENLAQTIADRQAGNPWRPVRVLTCSTVAGLQARRAVARQAGSLFNVQFSDPIRFAEQLVSEFGDHPKPIATQAMALAAAWSVLKSAPPDLSRFSSVSTLPAQLVRAFEAMDKAEEVEAVRGVLRDAHQEYRSLLTGFSSRVEVATEACRLLQTATIQDILTFGLEPLEMEGNAFAGELKKVAHQCPFPLDSPDLKLVQVHDQVDEARYIVAQIQDLVLSGVPAHEIGVLILSPEPYGKLLAIEFERAGILWNGTSVVRLSDRPIGQSIRAVRPEASDWKTAISTYKTVLDQASDNDQTAAQRIDDTLDTWVELNTLVPQPKTSLLEALMEAALARPDQQTLHFGDGVFMGRIADMAGLRFKHLVVPGFTANAYPYGGRTVPLLPRGFGATSTATQWKVFDHLLRSSEAVTLTHPRLDRRNDREAFPSPWIDRLEKPKEIVFDSPRQLVATFGDRALPFSEWKDRPLDQPSLGINLTPKELSPSAIETFMECPRKWFYRYPVGLRDPDRDSELGPLADKRGSALHRVLADLFRRHKAELQNPDYVWTTQDRDQVAAEYRLLLSDPIYHPDHPAVQRETERCIGRIHLMLDYDNDHRQSNRAVPICLEENFSGSFRSIALKGQVDRIDRLPDGSFIVIDYKAGTNREKPKLGPLQKGARVQGILYGLLAHQSLGANPREAQYWYFDEEKKPICTTSFTQETEAEALQILNLMKRMTDEGTVPMQPYTIDDPNTACPYCVYQRICPASRLAIADEQRELPVLAHFYQYKAPKETSGVYEHAATTTPAIPNAPAPKDDPPDKADRDRAIEQPHKSMVLEAGAGSGKTHTMVNRLSRSLTTGHRLDRIVAITFTTKAAYELTDRLRKELKGEDKDALGEARIGTIDSILQVILNEYALEAGIPGGAQLLAASDFNNRRDSWFLTAFNRWAADPSLSEAWAELSRLGLKQRQIIGKLKEIVEESAQQRANLTPLTPFVVAALIEDWRNSKLAEASSLAQGWKATDQFLEGLKSLETDAEAIASDPEHICRTETFGNRGDKAATEFRQAFKRALDGLKEIQAAYRYSLIRPLMEKAVSDHADWINRLKDQGWITFDSALDAVNDLLKTSETARQELQSQVDAFLIDEFQDTSPAQMDFVELITRDSNIPLFVVGDPKQSIYRFRGADLPSYNAFRKRLEDGQAEMGALYAGFRSQPAVIDMVNRSLGSALQDSGLRFDSMAAHGKVCGAVESHVGAIGGKCESADDMRRIQADMVASAVKAALGEEWKVGAEARAIQPGDIAILCTTRGLVEGLSERLELDGLKTQIESPTAVMDAEPARAILNVLTAITRTEKDDAKEVEIAKTAAYRSLAFRLTDQEILAKQNLPNLEPLRQVARILPPGRLVRAIMDQTELSSLEIQDSEAMRYVLDRALALESEGVIEARALCDRLDLLADEDGRLSPVAALDRNAVRLMTIHAAKGLEFPFVIVVGVPNTDKEFYARDHDGRIHFKFISSDKKTVAAPLGFEVLREAEKTQRRHEALRLLYVAMTRAKDHLLVSAYYSDREDLLRSQMAKDFPIHFADSKWTPVQIINQAPPDSADLINRWQKQDQTEPRTTPSRLAHDDRPDEESEQTETYRSPAARRGTAIGKAFHQAMQSLDLQHPLPEEVSRRAAQLEGLEASDIAPMVQRCLDAPSFASVCQAPHVLREVYAATQTDGLLIEGMVDLVYEKPDGTLGVIDYKTDSVFNLGQAEERMAGGYRKQGEAYREMLTLAIGKNVSSVDFIFVRPDPALVISL